MDTPTYLTNHQLVVAFFGYWPSFHDAKVASYTGLTSEAKSLRFTLHTWEMTSEIDAKGYFVLTKHALVEFEFDGVREAEMNAFGSDNILFELSMSQDADSCRICVELESVMDRSGSFTANSGAVLSIMPCTPDGLVLSPVRKSLQGMANTTTLYRPVGQRELDLIAASNYRAFPPRFDWQPIFYPVLNEEYAIQIARDWNTKDAENGAVGYVTRFAVPSEYLARYPVQQVGGREHLELWVPAEELADFNAQIVGRIEVMHEFRPGS